MTDVTELVKALREEADWCQAIEWEIPICTEDHIREAADLIEKLVTDIDVVRKERDEPGHAYHNGYEAGKRETLIAVADILKKEKQTARQIRNSYQHKIGKYRRDSERYRKELVSAKSLIDLIYSETKLAVELDFRPYGNWFVKVIDEWRGKHDK